MTINGTALGQWSLPSGELRLIAGAFGEKAKRS
jgi:hypothetical protein